MAAREWDRSADVRAAAVYWLALCCCGLNGAYAQKNSCWTDVNRDLAQQEPLLLVDGQLTVPRAVADKGSAVILISGDATLACPGRGNRLVGLGQQRVGVSCDREKFFRLAGRQVALIDIACSKRLSASLEGPGGTCGSRGGQKFSLGYQVDSKFYDIITTCYNTDEVSALYSEHVLHGSGIGGRQRTDGTPNFESGSANRGFSIAVPYKQATVLRTLTQLLGSKKLADRYTSQTFISRGHLSPRADFILQAYQNATFFYVNVVPQWQSVNRGNWLHVEDAVRKHAQQHGSDLRITTGTYQVLELPNQQGRLKQVYLHNDGVVRKLPVPKILWKVVHNADTRSAIAFVTLNNPFLGEVQNEELLCQDVCQDYGWQFSSQHTFTLGYTYCCDVNVLRQTISYIPAMKADHILRNR